jgi:vacuolar protein sorting-associated protein 3
MQFPQGASVRLARRIGPLVCFADHETYNILRLDAATVLPLLPVSQVPPDPRTPPILPHITVVGDSEFLIVSWTGAGALGVFVNGNGDPVRGTLEWASHPLSMSLYTVLVKYRFRF